jgi:hypothetical protein
MADRKKLIYDNYKNVTLCQSGCNFLFYDFTNQKVECKCKAQKKSFTFDFDETFFEQLSLAEGFYKTLKNSNFLVLKCYKLVFSLDGIIKNYGSYVLTFITLVFISSIFGYCIKGKIVIDRYILGFVQKKVLINKNIINITDIHSKENAKKKTLSKPRIDNKKKTHFHKLQIKNNNINIYINNNKAKVKKNKNHYPPKRSKNRNKTNPKNNSKMSSDHFLSNRFTKKTVTTRLNLITPKDKQFLNNKNIHLNKDKNKSIFSKKKEGTSKDKNKSFFSKLKGSIKKEVTRREKANKEGKRKEGIKKVKILTNKLSNNKSNKLSCKLSKNIIKNNSNNKSNQIKSNKIYSNKKYLDIELDNLDYQKALIFDHRTYFQYYCSLIHKKQLLFFTFCRGNDYNLVQIKVCLLLFSFSICLTINGFFFSDESMNRIYIDNGEYNFIDQIPQILYSLLVSSFINTILKRLSLTESLILSLKHETKNIKEKASDLRKNIKTRITLFFIIGLLDLLFFWYFISCFCAVYKNTQLILIYDSLLSFALSMIYPFGLNLIPGMFRITALRARKKDKKCLYRTGNIVALI